MTPDILDPTPGHEQDPDPDGGIIRVHHTAVTLITADPDLDLPGHILVPVQDPGPTGLTQGVGVSVTQDLGQGHTGGHGLDIVLALTVAHLVIPILQTLKVPKSITEYAVVTLRRPNKRIHLIFPCQTSMMMKNQPKTWSKRSRTKSNRIQSWSKKELKLANKQKKITRIFQRALTSTIFLYLLQRQLKRLQLNQTLHPHPHLNNRRLDLMVCLYLSMECIMGLMIECLDQCIQA